MRRDTTLPWRRVHADTRLHRYRCRDCRKHKLRCSGREPCERCSETGRQCQYGLDTQASESRRHTTSVRSEVATTASHVEQLQLFQRIFSKLHANVSTDPESLRRFYMHLQSTTPEYGGEQSTASAGRTVENSSVQEHHQHHQHGSDSLCDGSSPNRTASVTVVSQGKTRMLHHFFFFCKIQL